MVHPKSASAEHDPLRRTRLLSRILDPEYAGSRPRSPSSLANLPQPSVFVDRWGTQHDPDFRPFGSYPVRTPSVDREHQSWPWDADDDDDDDIPLPAFGSPRRSPTAVSHSSSSYQSSSSGSRSRSTSVVGYSSPASSPPASNTDRDPTRARIASPGKIPRSALFPWTPAQRAARLHELPKVPPPPPPVEEEEQDIPLALVDSRYVPGYGHILYPPSPSPAPTPPPAAHRATSPSPSSSGRKKNRPRAHTVPLPASPRANLATGDAEQEAEQPGPESSSCKQSLRQSVYSLGLKTKLGLHHMKARIRKASGAATRPLSL